MSIGFTIGILFITKKEIFYNVINIGWIRKYKEMKVVFILIKVVLTAIFADVVRKHFTKK